MFPVHIPSSILHGEVVGTGSFWPTFRGGDGSCIIPSSVISVTISLNSLLHIQCRNKCFCLFVCFFFFFAGVWVSICHLVTKRIQCNSYKGFLWIFFHRSLPRNFFFFGNISPHLDLPKYCRILKFCPLSCLFCSPIWLIPLLGGWMDDHHHQCGVGTSQKLKRKKPH